MVNVRRKHGNLRQLKLNCFGTFSPEGLFVYFVLSSRLPGRTLVSFALFVLYSLPISLLSLFLLLDKTVSFTCFKFSIGFLF